MSFIQIEQQKEYFFKSYIAIENIANIGHLYCCCQIYSGSQTIHNFLRNLKMYCYYCQFADCYNLHSLNEIKRDVVRIKKLYNEILGDVENLKVYQNVNQFVSDFNIFDPFCYVENLYEEQLNELRDFFHCRLTKKILILLFLFSISETFFITLISFICGYCVGYYFYELLRPKKSAENILQFFSSYNRKHGFVNSYTK